MGINQVAVSGNLTRDPELRTSAGGLVILKLGLAVNDRHKDSASGEWVDSVNFLDVVVFGNRGEALSRFLLKGQKVAVAGRLHWSSWDATDGSGKRSKVEIIADELELMNRPPDASTDEGAAKGKGAKGKTADEDVPF